MTKRKATLSGARPALGGQAARKYNSLKKNLSKMKRVLVAFSGGADSTLLLKTAADVLGSEVLAVIAASETYPGREIREAKRLADRLGVRHRIIHTRELDNPAFARNNTDRCYHCKKELFSRLKGLARAESIPFVLDGQNADDRSDYRPGSRAARELGVRSPLQEAGLTKEEVRLISRRLRLPNWNKPSLACLASRFPYGESIDRQGLARVAAAEEFLLGLGLGQVRVRSHGRSARIEVEPLNISRLAQPTLRAGIVRRLKALGFIYVTLDLQGYRSGSLNEVLKRS